MEDRNFAKNQLKSRDARDMSSNQSSHLIAAVRSDIIITICIETARCFYCLKPVFLCHISLACPHTGNIHRHLIMFSCVQFRIGYKFGFLCCKNQIDSVKLQLSEAVGGKSTFLLLLFLKQMHNMGFIC